MSSRTISIDPERAAESVNVLAKNGQRAEDVSSGLLAQGTQTGAAYDFKAALNYYVGDLKSGLRELKLNLEKLQENVTATIVELGEQDAALESQTKTFLAGVDAVEKLTLDNGATYASGPAFDANKGIA